MVHVLVAFCDMNTSLSVAHTTRETEIFTTTTRKNIMDETILYSGKEITCQGFGIEHHKCPFTTLLERNQSLERTA